jgi:serine/threonine protein kinase
MLKNIITHLLLLQTIVASVCTPYEDLSGFYKDQLQEVESLELLGEGMFGRVYKIAWSEETDPMVDVPAIIKVQTDIADEVGAMFESEAEILAQLHDGDKVLNVPRMLGCVLKNKNRYSLIVERIDFALTPKIHDKKINKLVDNPAYIALVSLPAPKRLLFFAQVAEGLGSIHAKKIIHGDIKPENLMMNITGDERQVFFVDFGTAVKLGFCSTSTSKFLTDLEYFKYCRPVKREQRRHTAIAHSEKQDIYALAITFYIIETQFDQKNKKIKPIDNLFLQENVNENVIMEIAKRVADKKWTEDSKLNYTITLDDKGFAFVQLIRQMMHKDRAKRPSADQVASLLKKFAKGKIEESSKGNGFMGCFGGKHLI